MFPRRSAMDMKVSQDVTGLRKRSGNSGNRRAIISMHLDGYENPEIAEVIGISNNNVAVKLYRIKQQLAHTLKQLG